jgi:class 3 adenylate cyclase
VADEIPQRLSAVLAADISSYTRLMEIDEAGTVAAWRKARADVIDPAVSSHQGRIVKLTGGGPSRTLALPMAGRTLAELFATPLDTAPLSAPDVRVLDHDRVAPGPDPATYVFVRADDQQNLFRVPLHAAALAALRRP